jgi:hypothetical protein
MESHPAPDLSTTAETARRSGADGPDGDSTAVRRRGSEGGYARAARLTAEQRSEIARQAARARWQRFRNGVGTGPPEARLGGLARAQRLTPEQRQQIARNALEARLSARRHDEPLDPADERPMAAAYMSGGAPRYHPPL